MVRSLGTLIGQSIVTSCHSAQAEQILSRWQGSCLFMMHRSPAVLVCVLALLAMGQVCEAHMTEFCLSRLPSTSTTDNFRLLIEHWHGANTPPPGGAQYRLVATDQNGVVQTRQGAWTGAYLPTCTNGCPSACTRSFDCGNESSPGHYYVDLTYSPPLDTSVNAVASMLGGGVYTQAQGACFTGTSEPQNLPIQIPPQGCIADICGDGVMVAPEQCDGSDNGGAQCSDPGMPGGPFVGGTLTCTGCCQYETSQCLTCGNNAVCRSHTETLSSSGSGVLTFAELNGGSTVCPGSSVSLSTTNVGCGNVGTFGVTVTITDGITSDSCVASVTVVDNTNPSITGCPGASTINTDTNQCTSTASFGTASASDACGIASIVPNPAAPYGVGSSTVTWTATDNNGLTATCSHTLTVVDNQVPVITCPGPTTINTDAGICQSSQGFSPATATDNCGISQISASPSYPYSLGSTTVTWTALDDNGLSSTCSHQLTVVDNENPTISCPADETFPADTGRCDYSGPITQAIFGDNCGATLSQSPSGTFPLGSTTVVWTATDAAGNTATCSNVITIEDRQNPTFLFCPADIIVNMDPGLCSSTLDIGTPMIQDNCPGSFLTQDPLAPFPPFPATGPETVTVTHTATDAPAGNTAVCTQQVTTIDNQDPTLIVPNDLTYNLGSGTHQVITYSTPTCFDNCQCSVSHVSGPLSGDALLPGTYTVTYQATDSSDRVVQESFNIEIDGVAILTPDPGSGDGTIYMYIPRPIAVVAHGAQPDREIQFDFYPTGQSSSVGYTEVTSVESTVVTVFGTLPGYYDLVATGMQSGITTMGPTIRLCTAEWEGGPCVEPIPEPTP